MLFEHENPFSCRDARRLMAFMSDNDPDLSLEERESFEQHLRVCPSCAAEYEEDKELTFLLKQYWRNKNAHESNSLCDKPYRPMTIEESWEDLKRRCPDLAEACRRDERKRKLRRVAWRIGKMAAAACIVMAVGVGWFMHKGQSSRPEADHVGSVAVPSAFAELVSDVGRMPLQLDQPITSGAQPQEILLGGMHRVVMNSHTQAVFTAAPAAPNGDYAGKITYEIRLARGELYVEVIPGHPFTVLTDNAQLDITGTKFNVSADQEKTALTLLKGGVRFSALEQPKQAVSVSAGHASTIVGRGVPTAPAPVDALATTAWARNLVLTRAVGTSLRGADLEPLEDVRSLWPQAKPVDLEALDYAKWRDEHRDWFARQFPWIPRLQEALAQRGVEADYIELLMVSGDIWQFHYPRQRNQPIPSFNAGSVKRVAAHYAMKSEELLKAIGAVAGDQESAVAEEAYLAALRMWRADLHRTASRGGDVLLFTLRAGPYLTLTRTAAWLWARTFPQAWASLPLAQREGLFAPSAETPYAQRLDRLAADVEAAERISRTAAELLMTPKSTGCFQEADALKEELSRTAAALAGAGGGG